MRKISAFYILFFLLLSGCNSNAMKGDSKTSDQSKIVSKSDKDDSEVVVAPTPISGSYLRCAEEVAATADNVGALYGCQLTTKDGIRGNFGISGVDYQFGWRQATSDGLSVFIKHLPSDQRFDALYLFRSNDYSSLAASLLKIDIILQSKNEAGVFHENLSSALSSVTVEESAIPEPKPSDYTAIRNDLTVEANASSPTPPIPE